MSFDSVRFKVQSMVVRYWRMKNSEPCSHYCAGIGLQISNSDYVIVSVLEE